MNITSADEIVKYSELLDAIDAPASLERVVAVLKNIRFAFDAVWFDDILRDPPLRNKVEELLAAADELIAVIKKNRNSKEYHRDKTRTELVEIFPRILTKNPLYPVLYLINTKNHNFFKWARHLLLVLKYLVREKKTLNERFKNYEFNDLSVFFRRLTKDETAKIWLMKTNCQQCKNLSDFVGLLYNYRYFYKNHHALGGRVYSSKGSLTSSDPLQKHIYLYHEISKIIQILEIPLGYKKNRKLAAAKARSNLNQKILVNMHGVTELQENVILQIESLPNGYDSEMLYSILQVDFTDDIADSGEEVLEQQQEESYVFQDNEYTEEYIAAFHARRLSKAVTKRIERQHQFLKTESRTLSNYELSNLIKFCSAPGNDFYDLSFALTLSLVFFTSKNHTYFNNIAIDYDDAGKHTPHISLKDRLITLPAFEVLYTSGESTFECQHEYSDKIYIPLPEIIENIALTLVEKYDYISESSYVKALDKEKVSREIKLHGSLSKIQNHLFLRACEKFGSACATLMFSRPAPGSQARLYYTALDINLLQKRYYQLIESVSSEAGCNISFQNLKPQLQPSLLVGCRDLPSSRQYQKLLSTLQGDIADLRKQIPSTKKTDADNGAEVNELHALIRFHNIYTTYCIACQGLLTGLRPTHSGFINLSNINLESKIAILRDKDSEDEFHTRTLPITPTAIKIAEAYRRHINAMLGHLHRFDLLDEWIAQGNPEPFYFTPKSLKQGKRRYSISSYRPFLYQQHVENIFNLPPNSNRRYLRSRLETLNVKSFFIDCFLGHANLGESLWHKDSTLSLREVRDVLEQHLEKLVEELGIKILKGID